MARKKSTSHLARASTPKIVVQQQIKPSAKKRRESASEGVSHPLATRPTMLLVLGMHRSGTSVTARLIECLGAVNSTHLMPPAQNNNAKGFFEDFDVYQFNHLKLLPSLGVSWKSLDFVDWSNLSTPARSKFALEALEILRKNYSLSNSLSVLKEPCIGILLPFWLSVLKHAGYNPQIVCAIRDPASVARSLSKRDGFTINQGGMLYVTNWISILSCIQELPVAFVHFDDVFSNPSKVLRGVASKLGIPVPGDFDARIHAFSSSFFDASLRHSTLDRRDLPLEADLPPMAIELYDTLLAAAQSQSIKKTSKFVTSAEETISKIKPVLADYDRYFGQLGSERQKSANLEGHRAQLNAQLEALKCAPAEATLLLEREALRRGQLAERVTALEGTKQQLASDLDSLRQQQQAAEEQIATLTTERSTLSSDNSSLATSNSLLVTEREALSARLSTLSSEHAALVTSHSSLLVERDALATDKATLDSRLSTLVTEREALATQNTTLVGERGQLAERVTALEGTKQQLASDLDSLRQQQQAAEEQIATLTTERSTLSSDNSSLATSNSLLVTEREALSARLSTLSSEHAALVTSHSSLLAERDALATDKATLDSRLSTLVTEREALAARVSSLEADLQERFEELAKLAKMQIATEDDRDALQAKCSELQAERNSIAAEHSTLSSDNSSLATSNSLLATEREALSADLQERFVELALLGKRLLEVEGEADRRVAEIQSRLDAMVARFTWKLGAPARFVWDKTHNTAVKIARLPVALQILLKHRHSGFFNHEWYFEQNPDVKAATSRPFLHFAFHGVFEGRAPNPAYNESKYLQSNPSLKSCGKKPLLHYTLER